MGLIKIFKTRYARQNQLPDSQSENMLSQFEPLFEQDNPSSSSGVPSTLGATETPNPLPALHGFESIKLFKQKKKPTESWLRMTIKAPERQSFRQQIKKLDGKILSLEDENSGLKAKIITAEDSIKKKDEEMVDMRKTIKIQGDCIKLIKSGVRLYDISLMANDRSVEGNKTDFFKLLKKKNK